MAEVFGVEVAGIGQDAAIEAVVLIKAMDRNTGRTYIAHRYSDGLNYHDVVGMLEITKALVLKQVTEVGFVPDEDEAL